MTTFQRAALGLMLTATLGAAWMTRYTVTVIPANSGAVAYLHDRWAGTVELVTGTQRHAIKPAAAPNFFDQFDKAKPTAPAVGEVRDGYRFLGGDPSSRDSWAKVPAP
jgi:hypothetical protein